MVKEIWHMISIDVLNENQKEAVLSQEQYLRVVAGAGSGKTRVLTMRISHLIKALKVPAYKILAITFTNKAAREMKERIQEMLPQESEQPWISTIHSLCVRMLREDITVLGYPRNFTVMDTDDQKTILKEAYRELSLDATSYPHNAMLSYISNNKTAQISIEHAYTLAGFDRDNKNKARVYEFYLNRQKELYALDFDDLILWTVRMLKTFSQVCQKWQNRFSYIHVDEFQDIDNVQYELIRLLAGTENSLYVVGDPDQTIYTWRGANVDIIMNFPKDFQPTKTILLNQNYRSTSAILNGSNSVIKHNRHRLEKELFTSRSSDERITHHASVSDTYQAAWVAMKIKERYQQGERLRDMAILYRSNYLSRSLEKGLLDERIPYIIYGGIRFYERMEVKDALSYLRMVTVADDLAFQRIINKPKRGIGTKTLDTIAMKAREKGCSMYELIRDERIFNGKIQSTLNEFVFYVEKWKRMNDDEHVEIFDLFETIINESGLRKMLEDENELDRVENLKELIDDIKEFSENYPESTLDEYLQLVSLYGDRDETLESDYVQLMTVHAAKGLEFNTVFVTDLNDGIFPNERAMNEGGSRGVEEERRLAYVAFTRARNKLYLCEAGGFSFLLQKERTTSRFIKEIDESYIEHTGAIFQERMQSFASGHMASNAVINHQHGSEEILQDKGFRKHEKVIHSKFGEGLVLSCKAGIAEIAFSHPYGIRKIAANHPTLKRADKK